MPFAAYYRANMHDDMPTIFNPVQTVLFELEVENKKNKYVA